MTIKEGIEAMDAYFAGSKEEAFAKIGNPYKKKKVKDPVEEDTESYDATEFNQDSDVDYETEYNLK